MRDDRYSSEVGNSHFALEQGGIAPNTSVVKTTASKHLMGERQEAHGQLEKEKKKMQTVAELARYTTEFL